MYAQFARKVSQTGNLYFDVLGEMNTARRGHQAAVIDGRVVVVGGTDSDYNKIDSLEEMDEDGTWRILPGVTLKTPRTGFYATVVKKNIVCP